MSVRISAHDWTPGGTHSGRCGDRGARFFKEAGADVIDCSSGQVSKAEKPVLWTHVPGAAFRSHSQ